MKAIGSVMAGFAFVSALTLGLNAQQIDVPRTTKAPASKNPLEGNDAAIKNGMGLFRSRCADCHGVDARGVRSPDLTQVWASGRTDEGLFLTLKNGVVEHRDAGQPAHVRSRSLAGAGLPEDARCARLHRSAARQRRERPEDLPRQLRELPSGQQCRRTARARPVAHRRRPRARRHGPPDSRRGRRFPPRLRTGDDHRRERPGRSRA